MEKAEVKILVEGYTNSDIKGQNEIEKTCPTISLVKDKDVIMVVDPGVLESQQILINKLEEQGLAVNDVNYVFITHSHTDHYRNAGMFPDAKTIEYFGIWDENTVNDWQENFTENIKIIKTPGHSETSLSLLVKTEKGTVAICGDVFWRENYPNKDPYAQSLEKLKESRILVLAMSDFVIPGHGTMYSSKKINSDIFLNSKKENNGIRSALKEKIKNGFLGRCAKCNRVFVSTSDMCECQNKICFRCCECEEDCWLCNCKHRKESRPLIPQIFRKFFRKNL